MYNKKPPECRKQLKTRKTNRSELDERPGNSLDLWLRFVRLRTKKAPKAFGSAELVSKPNIPPDTLPRLGAPPRVRDQRAEPRRRGWSCPEATTDGLGGEHKTVIKACCQKYSPSLRNLHLLECRHLLFFSIISVKKPKSFSERFSSRFAGGQPCCWTLLSSFHF